MELNSTSDSYYMYEQVPLDNKQIGREDNKQIGREEEICLLSYKGLDKSPNVDLCVGTKKI